MRRAALLASGLVLAACGCGSAAPGSSGSSPAPPTAAAVPSGDWPMFDFNPQRTGVGPASTGINAANLRTLRARRVYLDGTVDSSPIELHGLTVGGGRRDVVIVTTSYGRTIAIDAATGHRLWEFVPPGIDRLEGSSQITTATPVADPGRRYVYAASPDGLIHKLSLATGGQVRSGGWPVPVTKDPTREKIPSALNLSGREVIATTGGYVGDQPVYQGHVVTIDRASGRIVHVWNSLCADVHRLLAPRTCPASGSAIWGRAGAVVEPGSRRLLVSTGNADFHHASPFDGRRFWPDSVLELTPDAARLLHNWTPRNQAQLSGSDSDLGSTAPALLGRPGGPRLAVQGGKDGLLHLLDLGRLDGTTGPASARTGGELQNISAPGGAQVLSAPAVWVYGGRTRVFVADGSGTAIYELTGGAGSRLRQVAANGTPGTSPVVAGGLLYVYDHRDGTLEVYDPSTLHRLISLPAAVGHWNSPIVVGGRIVVPEGDDNDHSTRGILDIFHLPGR